MYTWSIFFRKTLIELALKYYLRKIRVYNQLHDLHHFSDIKLVNV